MGEAALYETGITAETGEGRFSPAQPMTVNQWAVMLCRAYGGSDWREESRSGVTAAYQKGWVHESAVLYPDTRLCRIPAPILDAFNAAGWKCSIDFDYTAALGECFGASCTGAASYEKRTIYLAGEEAALHEFGHFLAGALGFPAEHERLFRAEGACAPLRNYAKTDSAEYFADCFACWITNSGSTQAMARFQAAAPRTYAYFQALATDGWGVSFGSFAPVHGAG